MSMIRQRSKKGMIRSKSSLSVMNMGQDEKKGHQACHLGKGYGLCAACHDDDGVYSWINGKQYCQPCSNSLKCAECGIEMYSTIASDGKFLASDFKDGFKPETMLKFHEMNVYTRLYGHEKPKVKPVYNFFQYAKRNPIATKGKNAKLQPFCRGCLSKIAKKIATDWKTKRKEVKKKPRVAGISFGLCGVVKHFKVFEKILSYLTMPRHLVTISLVHRSWNNFLQYSSDLSWVSGLYIEPFEPVQTTDPLWYVDPKYKKALNWDDTRFLQMVQSFFKRYTKFKGFSNLKTVAFHPSLGIHSISDFSFMILSKLVTKPCLEVIDLRFMREVTWQGFISMLHLAPKLKKLRLSGHDQIHIFKKLMNSEKHRAPFLSLEDVAITEVSKLGLSILRDLQNLPNLKSLELSYTSIYWDKKGVWTEIQPFEKVTKLDMTGSEMPLRDSVADVFSFFPNVTDLRVDFIKRSSIADKVAMFKKCGPEFTEDISNMLQFRVAEHDELIIKQGEVGKEMYFLVKGFVNVVVGKKVIVKLPSGVFFGEIALLFDTPRTASIKAVGRCEYYVLSQIDMFRAMRVHPQSKTIIKAEAKKRYEELVAKNQIKSGSKKLKEKDEKPAAKKPKKKPKKKEEKKDGDKKDDGKKDDKADEKDEEEEEKEEIPPPPVAANGLLKEIQERYDLRVLHLLGHNLEIDFHELFHSAPSLETIFIKVNTPKLKPVKMIELPQEENLLPNLKTIRLDLSQSQFEISAASWETFGKLVPNVENMYIGEKLSNADLVGIVHGLTKLRCLNIPNSEKAKKAVQMALEDLIMLQEIHTNAPNSADTLLKIINKSHIPLKWFDMENVVFNESQLVKLLRLCPDLQNIHIQTSTMNSIDPEKFKTKYESWSHLDISVNHTSSLRGSTMRRRTSKSPLNSARSKTSLNSARSRTSLNSARSRSSVSSNEDNPPARSPRIEVSKDGKLGAPLKKANTVLHKNNKKNSGLKVNDPKHRKPVEKRANAKSNSGFVMELDPPTPAPGMDDPFERERIMADKKKKLEQLKKKRQEEEKRKKDLDVAEKKKKLLEQSERRKELAEKRKKQKAIESRRRREKEAAEEATRQEGLRLQKEEAERRRQARAKRNALLENRRYKKGSKKGGKGDDQDREESPSKRRLRPVKIRREEPVKKRQRERGSGEKKKLPPVSPNKKMYLFRHNQKTVSPYLRAV